MHIVSSVFISITVMLKTGGNSLFLTRVGREMSSAAVLIRFYFNRS